VRKAWANEPNATLRQTRLRRPALLVGAEVADLAIADGAAALGFGSGVMVR